MPTPTTPATIRPPHPSFLLPAAAELEVVAAGAAELVELVCAVNGGVVPA